MRIVIDMQGAQSTGSRGRGIGRYSMAIAKALIKVRAKHEVILALSGLFSDTITDIRASFEGLLPQENIRVWWAFAPTAFIDSGNMVRRELAELSYEAFLVSLAPDFIYVTSLFEGLTDDAVTSVHRFSQDIPVAVTLYDLIPFIHQSPYLENPVVKTWYMEKIDHLRRADLFFAISESSRQEGIDYLGLPTGQTINVSTDADASFQPVSISSEQAASLRQTYGLTKPFVMYTGGIDYRKNIEGLIRAYASLPVEVRQGHQLAIVCSIQSASREALSALAVQEGLGPDECVLTGFVSDEDLLRLYNMCQLFVFPSWHEGFGLPALEAMRCGAAVIGANTSSLPEVIGWEDALFDPHSDSAMAAVMLRALTEDDFRQMLIAKGVEQAKRFSWEASAQSALSAMVEWHAKAPPVLPAKPEALPRKRLAYISPLPPARSGIADYSAELLPALAEFYDIDVVVAQDESPMSSWVTRHCRIQTPQWLVEHADQYDRVLYHFGNSSFHQHMFALLERVPGVVFLHDFFLSGILARCDMNGIAPGVWAVALYASHGYGAVADRYNRASVSETVYEYPANLLVLQRALGVLVHSENSRVMARQWFGERCGMDWSVIPLLRTAPETVDRSFVRDALGFEADDLVVCSFGMLGPTKLNHRLLAAWLASPLAKDARAKLVFVGENEQGDYGRKLERTIAKRGVGTQVTITGWVAPEVYRHYLAVADIGVQLRNLSRGETSAAVLDCMNFGVATIVNAHGSMADLPPSGVLMLSDEFDDAELVAALTMLASDQHRRRELGRCASDIVHDRHAPAICARQYFEALESAYSRAENGLSGLLKKCARLNLPESECRSLASSLAHNYPLLPRVRQWMVDVTGLLDGVGMGGDQQACRSWLLAWLKHPPEGYRVEPVYATDDRQAYRYARAFTCRLLGIPSGCLQDEPVQAWQGDVFLNASPQAHLLPSQRLFLNDLHRDGVQVWFAISEKETQWLPQFVVARDQSSPPNADLSLPGRLWICTLEPCSGGYASVIDAFGEVLQSVAEVDNVIVSKQRYLMNDLVLANDGCLESTEFQDWLRAIDDRSTAQLAVTSLCFIPTIKGTALGMPLDDTVCFKLPVFAKEALVFREQPLAQVFLPADALPGGFEQNSSFLLKYQAHWQPVASKPLPEAEHNADAVSSSGWGGVARSRAKAHGDLPNQLFWRLEGPFDSSYSLALVNREIARALAGLGHVVALHSTEGPGDFDANPAFLEVHADISKMVKQTRAISQQVADVTSRNLYPPRVLDMAFGMNMLHAYGWEESGFPSAWVDAFNERLQGITVMSEHVKKVMIDNGVALPIAVSGLGVDHWLRIDEDETYKIPATGFCFLHVSSCFPRKGVDVLLRAFGRAFRASDPVTLIIKTFANPHNEIERWLNNARASDPHYPTVLVIEDDLSDAQLKALYQQCHALVAPSRAEGFGLPMAEAMCSGLPVITTDWSGQRDFCNAQTAWMVDYRFENAETHFDLSNSVWAEPDEGGLCQALQEVYHAPATERQRKTEAAQQLLSQGYQWADVGQRLVCFARAQAANIGIIAPKVGWVSTWNTRCGIAAYSENLLKNMALETRVFAPVVAEEVAEEVTDAEGLVVRCWQANGQDSLDQLVCALDAYGANVVVVQFNYGFFEFAAFAEFLKKQIARGRKVMVLLHSTVDPEGQDALKLSRLIPVFKECARILVHSVRDLNRLKDLGLVANVTLMPHGVVDSGLAQNLPVKKSGKICIGTFGFFLPNKGLIELIEAVALLREREVDVTLHMINAKYPNPVSRELLDHAAAIVKTRGLEACVKIDSRYHGDAEVLELLANNDLLVFPYQKTGESSSAAVRHGIAAGVPVAVTRLEIFNDVANAVHYLPGLGVENLAQGIASLIGDMQAGSSQFAEIAERARAWRDTHAYPKVAHRWVNMIKSILING